MYKILFTDLDETLLNPDHHVPQVNIDAINKAKEKGVKVVLATGRSHLMTDVTLKEIGNFDQEGEYIIAFNGAMIVEAKGFKEVLFQGLTYETTKELFDFGINYDVCPMVFTEKNIYMFNPDPAEVERKNKQKANYMILKNDEFYKLKDERIAKMVFMKLDDPYLHEVASHMTHLTDGKVAVSYSSSRYLEFNQMNVSKGQAVEWLSNYLNVDIKDTIAIGDNENDITMIKTAGVGIAVKCAKDDIKAFADDVTERDFYEGAVAEAIEKYIL